jgi:hypothetical protein
MVILGVLWLLWSALFIASAAIIACAEAVRSDDCEVGFESF